MTAFLPLIAVSAVQVVSVRLYSWLGDWPILDASGDSRLFRPGSSPASTLEGGIRVIGVAYRSTLLFSSMCAEVPGP